MMEDCRANLERDKTDNGELWMEPRHRPLLVMANTRMRKVDFPHVFGEDIDGWLFKCNSLFEMEGTTGNKKIPLLHCIYKVQHFNGTNDS